MGGKERFGHRTNGEDRAKIYGSGMRPGSKGDTFRCYRFGHQAVLCFCWVSIVSKHCIIMLQK